MKQIYTLISFLFVSAFYFSCSDAKHAKDTSNADTTKIDSVKIDSPWKVYRGTIPCADCPGIAMELKLKDNFTVESYKFELKETYLEAENGKDKSYETKGLYNFWRGNSNDENATIIVLNDDSAESAKRFFLQLGDSVLKVVDNKGDEIQSDLNFSLRRIK